MYGSNEPTAAPFTVHKDYAVYHSPVFRAAFEGNFVEGQTQEYRLQGPFDDNVVRMLAQWLYTQNIDLEQIRGKRTGESYSSQKPEDKWLFLVQLWVLADSLLMPKLQNMVVFQLTRMSLDELHLLHECCQYVYENTSQRSPLRYFFVDLFAFGWHSQNIVLLPGFFPDQMLFEMFISLREYTAAINPGGAELQRERYQVPEN